MNETSYHFAARCARIGYTFTRSCEILPVARFLSRWLIACFGIFPFACAAQDGAANPAEFIQITIKTEVGDIEVELNAKAAPKTVENFLRYVDAKHYDEARFHRTVTQGNQPDNKIKIEVIQAGVAPERSKDDFPPIVLERTSDTKLSHIDGAISMARDGPDTATSDFFICIGDQKELDFGGKRNPDGQGFAAFGRVTKGMEIVKKIQTAPAKDQSLSPPVKIISVRRKA